MRTGKKYLPIILCLSVWVISLFFLIGNAHARKCGETYDRDVCFPHWVDLNHDGLDSRQDALKAQSVIPVLIKDHRVISGEWVAPYTNTIVYNPSKLDADHVVPLFWAWNHGAKNWTEARREQFANDPENILVVTASANRQKGAKGPDKWVPKNINYRFVYISKFWSVCRKYQLRGCK